MTALLRRFDCGHTEFTGAQSSAGVFGSLHLGTMGPCSQCIADGAKSVKRTTWADCAAEPLSADEIRAMVERVRNHDPFER